MGGRVVWCIYVPTLRRKMLSEFSVLLPWKWKQQIFPNHWWRFVKLHGFTFKRTVIFVVVLWEPHRPLRFAVHVIFTWHMLLLLLLLLLPLALYPTVGFGPSNNVLPLFPICHQLSPASQSQHLKISLYFLFPSFPGSSPFSRPFQFLTEDLFGHPILLHSR